MGAGFLLHALQLLLLPRPEQKQARGWKKNTGMQQHPQGQKKDALDALERSVKLAQPGGSIRTFLDLGAQMSWMLRQLVNRGVAIDYVRRILTAFPESDSTIGPLKDDPAHIVCESSKFLYAVTLIL